MYNYLASDPKAVNHNIINADVYTPIAEDTISEQTTGRGAVRYALDFK